MRKIPLKSIADESLGEVKFTTRDIIKSVVTVAAPNKGIDYDEMRRRIRILDALEALDETAEELILEDSDYNSLVALVKGFQFRMVSSKLFEILEDIVNAKKEGPSRDVSEKPAEAPVEARGPRERPGPGPRRVAS